ncbi:MAG: DUF4361 domain-containing protein [Prevotella sp.]|jgi:hypothetical protein|nr:DUF4361 domain-containing protein [Prevotella sp.]
MKYIKFINPLFFAILVLAMLSCDRDEIFDREQYKNVVALLSDDGFNIFMEELPFSEDGVDAYIAANCGGSLATTEPIEMKIIEDPSLLNNFNLSSYDTDVQKYANYLAADRYSINNSTITIPAGERSGRMKIEIRTAGLSPDSLYFIPFRVSSFSNYEVNPNKGTVMLQLFLKNYYATTKTTSPGKLGYTTYSHRGVKGSTNTMISKSVFPIGANEVRIYAGIKTYQTTDSEKTIRQWSLKLVVGEDNKVTILPWDSSQNGVKVTPVDGDPDYPNIFKIEDTGFKTYKTFLIRYDYVDPDDGNTYAMKEELRLEFDENDEE